MGRIADVALTIQGQEGEVVAFSDTLEVSLDCVGCKRRCRTVGFRNQDEGVCTPTLHAFPGRVIQKLADLSVSESHVRYRIAYAYEPFIDTKYPDEQRYQGKERGAPTWARVHFTIRCRKCGVTLETSTQSNVVRPWAQRCECGATLYVDEAPPVLSWQDAPTEP